MIPDLARLYINTPRAISAWYGVDEAAISLVDRVTVGAFTLDSSSLVGVCMRENGRLTREETTSSRGLKKLKISSISSYGTWAVLGNIDSASVTCSTTRFVKKTSTHKNVSAKRKDQDELYHCSGLWGGGTFMWKRNVEHTWIWLLCWKYIISCF